LPFVFAVWALRPGVSPVAAHAFRALRDAGVASIGKIVRNDDFATAEVREKYLTSHIRFEIGGAGREAITRYRSLLVKHGLIARAGEPLVFV
jgi:chorismate dehydratase